MITPSKRALTVALMGLLAVLGLAAFVPAVYFGIFKTPTADQQIFYSDSGTITGDPTFLWNKTLSQLTVPRVSGLFVVDGVKYTTVQAAITATCAAGGGTVFLPPGTYARNSTFTLCSNLNLIGAGRGQADGVGCVSTITTNQVSGNLFDFTGVNDGHYSDFCIKNLAGAGAGGALWLSAAQRNVIERLYISGPFAPQIGFNSSSTAASSTIWNTLRDIHTTGTAANGTGCLFDATDATAKVINNNYLYNVTCTGGTGGFGLRTAGTSGTPVINENEIHSGELTASGGSAVTLAANTVRNFVCQNCNAEGSATGVTIGAGNTGKFDSSNISANGNNSAGVNVADSSAGGFTWPHNNIGGVTTSSFVDRDGNLSARGLCIAPATCDPGNVNYISGTAQEAAGTIIFNYLNTGFNPVKPINYTESAAPTPAAGVEWSWGDSAAHRWRMSNNGGAADDVLGAATTDTLKNKTLNGAASGNSVNLLNSQGATGAITGASPAVVTVYTFTIPAGTVQAGKCVRVTAAATNGNSVSATYTLVAGSTPLVVGTTAAAANNVNATSTVCNNAGVQNAQSISGLLFDANTNINNAAGSAAENFANAVTVKLTMQLTSPNTVTGKQWLVELLQ